jgi:hypothetical protein
MARQIVDNPGGWTRSLPGNTVEYEPGFSNPWSVFVEPNVLAAATYDYTLTINDSSNIYFVDMVSVSPVHNTALHVNVYINNVLFAAASGTGWVNIPLRQNPSIQLMTGDVVKVSVTNDGSAASYIIIVVNGTKMLRPSTFGPVPQASYTNLPIIGDTSTPMAFTDASTRTPTYWKWYMEGDVLASQLQNPSYLFTTAGNKYPKLTVGNIYGEDTYVPFSPIIIYPVMYMPNLTKVDPNNRFVLNSDYVAITGITLNEVAYVYRDFGVGYFSNIDIIFAGKMTSADVWGLLAVNGLGTAQGNFCNATGVFFVTFFQRTPDGYNILFLCSSAGVLVGSDSCVVSVNTYYYFRVVKPAGSATVTLYIYSDSAYTVLVDILVVTHAALNTTFRYFYPTTAYNQAAAIAATGESWNAAILSH